MCNDCAVQEKNMASVVVVGGNFHCMGTSQKGKRSNLTVAATADQSQLVYAYVALGSFLAMPLFFPRVFSFGK